MEQMETIGIIMMSISTPLLAFGLVMAVLDQRPKKDPNKR